MKQSFSDHKMSTFTTTWALQKKEFDEHDANWCTRLKVKFDLIPLFTDVYLGGKRSYQNLIGWKIRLFTYCEKQENMLILKYGNRLTLVERTFYD